MRNDGPVNIQMLGGFSVTCTIGGEIHTISDNDRASQKRWALMEYLILHRDRIVPKEELCDVLWPGGEIEAPVNTLKTLVHRVRASLDQLGEGMGKDLLLCQNGIYFWNSRIPTTVDTEEFDRFYLSARASRNPLERLDWSLRAVEIYGGDFLPRASGELWAVSFAGHYRTRFIELCCDITAPMIARGRFEELVRLLRKAVAIEPYEEALHIAFIRALIASGAREEAMRHYNRFTTMTMSQLGAAPSEALTELYRELSSTTHLPEMNLDAIRERMTEGANPSGVFFCGYEVFRELFQLTSRQADRSGQIVQLAMISVLSGRTAELTAKQLGTAMTRLHDTLNTELRLGDTCTQYSANQYLLMLPSADSEAGSAIINRLIRSFRRAWPKMNVILHYSLLPILPKQ